MSEKIILFGGTFDPVHIGHIKVAQAAAKKIGAKMVILIPARRSPHKNQKPSAPDNDRIEMLKLAVKGNDMFKVSNTELNRAEPSYTIDTIHQLKQKYGDSSELYWLIGADMVKSLLLWHKILEIMDQCNISVMNRGGYEKPDFGSLTGKLDKEYIEKLKKNMIETPFIEISSTEIRQQLADEEDVSKYLHPDVLNHIKKHKLYIDTD
jgi:nicotinate-nucleotide adenylyltransferase